MASRKRSKRCPSCKTTKGAAQFGPNRSQSDGLQSVCKPCRKGMELKRRYGLTLDDLNAMREAQGNQCAVCGDNLTSGGAVHLDHCHETGVVRGILCRHCNLMLGHARDNPETLVAAAAYLKRYQ